MIEKDISNAKLMKDANISANIVKKIKIGKYIVLDKVERICVALGRTLEQKIHSCSAGGFELYKGKNWKRR